MKPHPSLTPEELQGLFKWLDPDLRNAVAKFQVIQRGLIERFLNRGCMDAETLADETIDRVAKKVPVISETYKGNPASYFHGVAKNVFLEYCRQKRLEARPVPVEPEPVFSELYYSCLEVCLNELSAEKRNLILTYYAERKSAKIESRKEIRLAMNLKADALRVRTHRVRKTLERCISECVKRNETD
jgi:DNA-directed RNA polymerase specialized sigma24 family protein